jgi:hypothetical protein
VLETLPACPIGCPSSGILGQTVLGMSTAKGRYDELTFLSAQDPRVQLLMRCFIRGELLHCLRQLPRGSRVSVKKRPATVFSSGRVRRSLARYDPGDMDGP